MTRLEKLAAALFLVVGFAMVAWVSAPPVDAPACLPYLECRA